VGLLLMRSYVLAGDTGHYDGVIAALEARGLEVVPAFASGLDSRPAIQKYFVAGGQPRVDAVVSLTGFSLVGGPAYNDSKAAEETLAALDVPYIAAQAVEFQSLQQWENSPRGLTPIEATMMVAISELDGSTAPMVFGGRSPETASGDAASGGRDMQVHGERAEMLAARVCRMIDLRLKARGERKVAVVLFNFPPNGGSTGTAAYLSVFASLHRVLIGLKAEGYRVDVPHTVDALRSQLLEGNAARFGADANVHHRIPVDDHLRREPWLSEIEAQWGPAPGRQQSDGASIHVLGAGCGNVFVGVQPAFGYEGDPMRLLFEQGFAPTHAFSAFYRFIREDFGADAVLHFGTHGALEFMPGKQVGMTAACWPERLIGDLPNLYLYAANNPSEGTIAKRRAAATLISYLTPSLGQAGLYRGLTDLKDSLTRWRGLAPDAAGERANLAALIQTQAAALDLAAGEPVWEASSGTEIQRLWRDVVELEQTLIPHGLHVIGEAMPAPERRDLLSAMAQAAQRVTLSAAALDALLGGEAAENALAVSGLAPSEELLTLFEELIDTNRKLVEDHEIPALLHALDGGFVRPAPGGDLLRTP
ncbi:MAG: cobaltochelatase subunit CobN, partial [Kiloniellaceae bacterium]